MNGKTLGEFFDTLLWGEEMEFDYSNDSYFIQGIDLGNEKRIEIYSHSQNIIIYSVTEQTFINCVNRLKNDMILDGKTIFELEKDITVTYG